MKLIKMSNGNYKIMDGRISVEGDLEKVANYMHRELGIPMQEIEVAHELMQLHGHDYASFGIRGKFVFSGKLNDHKKIKAELAAIQSLREEFTLLYTRTPESSETRNAYDRLMSMYMALNVEGAMDLLDCVEEAA